jgi:hypothetical protein
MKRKANHNCGRSRSDTEDIASSNRRSERKSTKKRAVLIQPHISRVKMQSSVIAMTDLITISRGMSSSAHSTV